MQITVTNVDNVGDDVLAITAIDDAGRVYKATGWVSATTNHYDPSAYAAFYVDANGTWQPVAGATSIPAGAIRDTHRISTAVARALTPTEVGAYALQCVLDQNGLSTQTAVAPVQFTAPSPVSVTP